MRKSLKKLKQDLLHAENEYSTAWQKKVPFASMSDKIDQDLALEYAGDKLERARNELAEFKANIKLTIPEVLDMFIAYFNKPENGAWGSLHVVLDDGNVQDDSVNFCLDYAVQTKDNDGEELAKLLLKMSKTQRLKLPQVVWDKIKSEKNSIN